MSVSISRQNLLAIHDDLQNTKQEHPGLAYINRVRIEDFYNGSGSKRGNRENINGTLMKITKLQEKYFQFTDDEQPKVKFTEAIPAKPPIEAFGEIEGVPAEPAIPAMPVMNGELTYEQFNKEYTDLMNELVTLY